MDAPGEPVPDPRPPAEWMKVAGYGPASSSQGDYYEEHDDNDYAPEGYVFDGAPADTSVFMEGLLKKRGDLTKSFRERWVVLCYDQELGYVLQYSECEEKSDGSVGPTEGADVKTLIVRGANLRAQSKIKGNAKAAIDREAQKLCLYFQEGPGGRTGDKIHIFKFETDEEKKEWEFYLKKAVEKTIKWSGNAGPKQQAKNAVRNMTDMVLGTVQKTFKRQMNQQQRKGQSEMTKSIKNFMENPFG